MAVNKVVRSDGTALIDLTSDTVTSANHIMEGYVGHLADGTSVEGTGTISASQQASLDALVRYSNEITGENDADISEAVTTLINNFRKGDSSSVFWKTVTIQQDHTTYGVDSGVVYWKEYLGIPDEDLQDGYIFFCNVLNNNDTSGWGKWMSGFYHALDGNIGCLFYRNSYDSTPVFIYDNEYAFFATTGTVIDIFRFKKGDSGIKRFSVEDIATGADLWGDVTIHSEYIRDYAFPRNYDTHSGQVMSRVKSITSLYAPNCLYVGERAFRLQSNLTRVILPECTTIKAYAFSGYSLYYYMSITELYIPKVETIESSAFYYNLHGFEKLVLPESLQILGPYAFAQNRYLKTVYFMGSNVTSISNTCFTSGVQTITDIYVPWAEGAVSGAPWGATNATIHYNTAYDLNGEPIVQ